ncbi:plasmid recombination protein [Pseudomonas sp. REP124]|uniref:MobV family relaxase n=1 Tax=Pseudomonas sp. REP124 TaxID=2875731 RepID=UPI001CC9E357|nr:MobV family relaxase [Pseudomonas sp. REP124]MBZ9781612.1 plasmid recombination protein [Pseudomonas sp. REP124]
MSYTILRTKKLKSVAGIIGSGRHTFREMPTPNSNGAANVHVGGASTAGGLANAVLAKLPERRRKGAVLCIEYLITASPEAFARHGGTMPDTGGYFNRAMAWLKARHGGANIVSATVHLDERTPHLVAYVVPLTKDGRLSARDFLGGAAKLRRMQTDFHQWCGKPFGLLRGVEGSKATHQKVSQYYLALVAADPIVDRADLAAAAIGIQMPNYKALLLRAKTSAIQDKLQRSATVALKARQAALDRQAVEHRQAQRALEELEITLEKRANSLDEVDHALEIALLKAGREKERADRLARQLADLLKRIPGADVAIAPH